MIIYLKGIRIYFALIFFIPFLIFCLFYYYDPLQIFHKSYITKDLYLHENMREQATGIINNYEFDSIILGTSMLENTSAFEASKLLGGTFVNISLSGSDFYERNFVLTYALKNRNIKKVIYSLDSNSYFSRKGDDKYPLETFNYLYDSNHLNDFKAYLNHKFFKCLITFSKKQSCIGKQTTFEYPNAWFKSQRHIERFGGLNNWFTAKNNQQVKEAFFSIVSDAVKIKNNETVSLQSMEEKINQQKSYINETLLVHIKNYPNTEFILFFPPYSRLTYAIWKQYNLPYYEMHKELLKYLVSKSHQYKNLKLFGFEDYTFLDDISQYKDLTHYHQSINSKMLHDFKNNIGLLTSENVEQYIKISEKKALNYNVFEVTDKINTYLNKN